jgi:hypothetical protein
MLLSLGESPRGLVVFHHGGLLELVHDGVHMVWTGCFKKLLKVVIRLPRRALEITRSGRDMLLVGVLASLLSLLLQVVVAVTHWERCLCPFLLPLVLLLTSLLATLGGAPRLPPGAVFPSP